MDLFISWVAFTSRSYSIAKKLNYKPVFYKRYSFNLKLMSIFYTYFINSIKTIRVILNYKPKSIIVMNPPLLLLFLGLILSKLYNFEVITDNHSAAFDKNIWKLFFPLQVKLFRRCCLNIVTNGNHKLILDRKGCNTLVLTDISLPKEIVSRIQEIRRINRSKNFYFFVQNDCYDEPMACVLKAFKIRIDLELLISGHISSYIKQEELPPNINFTGYLSQKEFYRTLKSSKCVITLTTREDTFQRAGSEALSFEKPVITSDTKLLREYFQNTAEYCKNDTRSLLKAINNIELNKDIIKRKIKSFNVEREKMCNEWIYEFRKFRDL